MIKKVNSIEAYERIGYFKKDTEDKITMGSETHNRTGQGFEKCFWNGERYIINSRTAFIKVYRPSDSNNCPDLADVIEDDADFGRMMRIVLRGIDDKNMIIYKDKHTRKGMPANRDLLYEMTGLSESRARKFIKKMNDLGVIKEWKCVKTSRFYVNPIYTMAERGITLDLYKLFREVISPYLTTQAVDDMDTLVYYENNPTEIVRLRAEQAQQQEAEINAIAEDLHKEAEKPKLRPGTAIIDLLLEGHTPEDIESFWPEEFEGSEFLRGLKKEAATTPASVVAAIN